MLAESSTRTSNRAGINSCLVITSTSSSSIPATQAKGRQPQADQEPARRQGDRAAFEPIQPGHAPRGHERAGHQRDRRHPLGQLAAQRPRSALDQIGGFANSQQPVKPVVHVGESLARYMLPAGPGGHAGFDHQDAQQAQAERAPDFLSFGGGRHVRPQHPGE